MKTLRHVLGFLLYALCSGCVKSDDPRCHDTSGEPGFMTAHPERAHILQDHPCPITTWTKTFTPRNHYSESQHTNGAEHNPEQSSRSVTLLGYGREIFEVMAALKYKGTKKDIKVSFILYKNGKFKFEDCFYTDADLLQRELECHRVYFHLNQMNYDQQHSNDHWCYNKLIMIPNRKESEMIDKADALNLHLNSFENSYGAKHKFRTRDDKLDNEERRIKGVLERNKLLSTKVKYNDLHDHYEAHAPQERHMICAPIHLKMSTFKKQQNENDFHTPAYQYIRPSEVMNTEHIKRAEDHIPAETNLFNNYLEDKSHSNQNFINYSNVQNVGNPLISRSRHSNVLYANSDSLNTNFKTASKSNSHIYYHAKPINYHSNEITIPKYKNFVTNPAYNNDISKPQSNVHHLGKGIDYVSLPINLNTDRYFKQLNILNRNLICSQSRHSNEPYANIESINTNFKNASKSNSHIYHYHTKPINYHGHGITIPKHENFVRNPGYTNHNNIGKPQTNIHHVGKRTDYVSLPINLNAARHFNQFIILNRNPISSQSNELYANNESINIKTASNSNRYIHHFHEKPINYQSYGITIPRLQATHFNYDKTKQAVPKYDNFITNPAYTNHISKPQSNIHHVGKGINYVSLPINLNTGRYFKQLNILNRNPVSRQSQQSNQLYANNISLNTNFKTDSNSNRHIYHAYQAKPINYHSHGITIPKYENFVTNLAYSNHNNIGKPQTNIHHLGKRIEYVSLPINLDTAKYFNLLYKSPGHKEFDFTNLNKHSDLSKFTMNNENMIVTDPFMYNTLVSTNLKKESYPLQNIYPGVDNSSNYQHFNQNIYSQTLHYVPNVEKTIVTMPDSCYYKNYVTVESNDNKWKEKTSSDTYPSNGNYYFNDSIKKKIDNYSSSQNPSIMSYAKHVQPNVYLNRLSTNIRKPKVATAITKNPAPEFQNNIPRPWSHNYLSHYIGNNEFNNVIDNASSNKKYKRGPYINTFQRNDLDEQKDQSMTYFFAFKGFDSDFRPIYLPIYLSKLSKGANIPKVSQQNIQYLTHDLYNKPLKAELNKNDHFIHLQVYLNNIYDQNQLSNVPFVRNLHSKPALSFNFPQTNYASKSIDDVKNKIIKQAISLKSPQMPFTNLKFTPAPFKYEYSSVNYKNHYNLNWSAVPLKVKHSKSPFFNYTPILKTQPIPNDLTQRHEYIHMKPENPQKALTSIHAKTEPTNYWIPRTHYYPNKNYNTASLEIHTAPEYKPSRIEDPVKPTNCITKPIIWQPGVGSEKTLNKCFQKAIPVMYISPNNILCKDDNKIEVQPKLISPVKSTSYITKPAFWQPEYISKIRSSPLYTKTPLFLTVKSITTTYKPTQSIKYNPNVSIKTENPQKSKMLVCQNSINTKPINYWIPRQIITPNNYYQTARSETPKTPEHLPCKNDRIVKLKPKLVSPVKPTSYITKPIWQSEYPSEQVLSPIYVTKPSTHSLQPLKTTNGVTPLINLSNINNKPTNYWKASNYITPYKYDRESKAEVQVSPVYKLNKTFYFVKEQPKTFRQLQYRSYKPSLSIYFKKPSTISRHQPSTIKNKPFNYWIPRQYITPNNNYQTATTETYITPDYEPCKIDYKIIVHPDSVPSVKSINYNTKSKISQSKYPSKMPSSSMHLQKPLTPTGTLLLPTLTTNGSTQSYKYSPIKLEFSQKSTTPICLNNVNTKPVNFWTSRKYVTANIPYQKSRLRIPIPRDFKPSKTFHNIRIQNGLVALGKSTSYKSVPAICQTKYTSEEPLTKTHVNKPLSLTLQPKTINNLSHNLVYGSVESVSPQKATTHISPSDVETKPVKYWTPRKYIKPDDYYQTASLIETHIRSDNKPCKNDHKIKVHPKLVSTVKPSNYIIKPAVWKSKYPIEQALPLCLQPKTTKNRPNQSFESILQSPHKTATQISKAKPSKETKPVNFWGPRKYVSSKKYYQKPRPEILDPQDLNTNKTFHDVTTQPGLVSLGKSTSYTTDPTIFQTKYPSEEPLSKKYFNKPLSHTLQPKTIIKDPTQRFIYSTVESLQKATTPICQNNINTIPVKYIPRKYITPNIYYQVARPKIQVALDYMPYKTYNNVQPKTIISSKLTSYSTEPTISQLKHPTEKPKITRFENKPSYISLQTITTTNNKAKSFKDNPINSKSHKIVTTPISPSKIKTEPSNYITPHTFYCPNNCYEKSKPEIYVTPDFILHKTSYNNIRIQSESPQKPASYTTKSVFWKSEYSEKPLLKKCSRKHLTPFLQATTTTTNDRILDFEYSPIKWERSQKATTHLIPSNKPMNYWIPRINVVPNIQYRKSRLKLYVTPYKTYSNVHPKTITLKKLSSYCTEPAIIQLEHNSKEPLSQKYSRKPLIPSPRPSTATNDTTQSLENNQINSKVNIKIKPVNYQTPNKYHEKVTKNIHVPPELKPCETFHNIKMQPRLVSKGKPIILFKTSGKSSLSSFPCQISISPTNYWHHHTSTTSVPEITIKYPHTALTPAYSATNNASKTVPSFYQSNMIVSPKHHSNLQSYAEKTKNIQSEFNKMPYTMPQKLIKPITHISQTNLNKFISLIRLTKNNLPNKLRLSNVPKVPNPVHPSRTYASPRNYWNQPKYIFKSKNNTRAPTAYNIQSPKLYEAGYSKLFASHRDLNNIKIKPIFESQDKSTKHISETSIIRPPETRKLSTLCTSLMFIKNYDQLILPSPIISNYYRSRLSLSPKSSYNKPIIVPVLKSPNKNKLDGTVASPLYYSQSIHKPVYIIQGTPKNRFSDEPVFGPSAKTNPKVPYNELTHQLTPKSNNYVPFVQHTNREPYDPNNEIKILQPFPFKAKSGAQPRYTITTSPRNKNLISKSVDTPVLTSNPGIMQRTKPQSEFYLNSNINVNLQAPFRLTLQSFVTNGNDKYDNNKIVSKQQTEITYPTSLFYKTWIPDTVYKKTTIPFSTPSTYSAPDSYKIQTLPYSIEKDKTFVTQSTQSILRSPNAVLAFPSKLYAKSANIKPKAEYSAESNFMQKSLHLNTANNVNIKNIYTARRGSVKINEASSSLIENPSIAETTKVKCTFSPTSILTFVKKNNAKRANMEPKAIYLAAASVEQNPVTPKTVHNQLYKTTGGAKINQASALFFIKSPSAAESTKSKLKYICSPSALFISPKKLNIKSANMKPIVEYSTASITQNSLYRKIANNVNLKHLYTTTGNAKINQTDINYQTKYVRQLNYSLNKNQIKPDKTGNMYARYQVDRRSAKNYDSYYTFQQKMYPNSKHTNLFSYPAKMNSNLKQLHQIPEIKWYEPQTAKIAAHLHKLPCTSNLLTRFKQSDSRVQIYGPENSFHAHSNKSSSIVNYFGTNVLVNRQSVQTPLSQANTQIVSSQGRLFSKTPQILIKPAYSNSLNNFAFYSQPNINFHKHSGYQKGDVTFKASNTTTNIYDSLSHLKSGGTHVQAPTISTFINGQARLSKSMYHIPGSESHAKPTPLSKLATANITPLLINKFKAKQVANGMQYLMPKLFYSVVAEKYQKSNQPYDHTHDIGKLTSFVAPGEITSLNTKTTFINPNSIIISKPKTIKYDTFTKTPTFYKQNSVMTKPGNIIRYTGLAKLKGDAIYTKNFKAFAFPGKVNTDTATVTITNNQNYYNPASNIYKMSVSPFANSKVVYDAEGSLLSKRPTVSVKRVFQNNPWSIQSNNGVSCYFTSSLELNNSPGMLTTTRTTYNVQRSSDRRQKIPSPLLYSISNGLTSHYKPNYCIGKQNSNQLLKLANKTASVSSKKTIVDQFSKFQSKIKPAIYSTCTKSNKILNIYQQPGNAFYLKSSYHLPESIDISQNRINSNVNKPENINVDQTLANQIKRKLLESGVMNNLFNINQIDSIKLYNGKFPKNEIAIQLGNIGMAKCMSTTNDHQFTLTTDDPNIEIKAWKSKLRLIKAKLVLDLEDFTVTNFVPIVKNNHQYDINLVEDKAKEMITKEYGEPLLHGFVINTKPYAFISDVNYDDLVSGKVNILWPACDPNYCRYS